MRVMGGGVQSKQLDAKQEGEKERGEKVGGFWLLHPWTQDHNVAKWRSIIECAAHWEEVMMQQMRSSPSNFPHPPSPSYQVPSPWSTASPAFAPYAHIELLGVQQEWQGRGIGKALVRRACDIADEEGLRIYTQSGGAWEFFEGVDGFETVEEEWGGGGGGGGLIRRF